MELEKMKNIWEKTEETQKPLTHKIYQISQIEYNKKVTIFRTSEIIGLLIAYTLAGFILYKFASLDNWYLRLLAVILIIYLFMMPLYTLLGVWKMKKIDLAKSNCKTVLEQIYTTKNNLKKAEKISFIASPFLFIASIAILTKLFTDKNFFALNIRFAVIFFIVIIFLFVIIFNTWAFKKRDEQIKSVKQLLDEEN